jgi:uncharacterized membrane-anchored protein YhcB (DUF1043 family)
MLWWDGSHETPRLIVTMVVGVAVGYFWYRFTRRRLLPRLPLPSEQSTGSKAKL